MQHQQPVAMTTDVAIYSAGLARTSTTAATTSSRAGQDDAAANRTGDKGPGLARSLVNIAQGVRGRANLRFAFELVPVEACGLHGLPEAPVTVSLVWEKGASVSYTDYVAVDASGTAEFAEVMHHTTTIYKHGGQLVPKAYKLKLQALLPDAATNSSRRRVVAKATLDLAQFCSPAAATASTAEVQVPLAPAGSLTLRIKSQWLQQHRKAAGAAARAGGGQPAADTSSVASSCDSGSGAGHNSGSSTSSSGSSCASGSGSWSVCPGLLSHGGRGPSPQQRAQHGSSGGSGGKCHRRSSSMPQTLTIWESHGDEEEEEGYEPGSMARVRETLSCADAPSSTSSAHSHHAAGWRRGQHSSSPCSSSSRSSSTSSECGSSDSSSTAAASGPWCVVAGSGGGEAAVERAGSSAAAGAEGLRALSGRMPAWLWPSSRLAVRDMTTDDLLRCISGTKDLGRLQHVARGLLCERNDWRYRATQAERALSGLEQQLAAASPVPHAAQQPRCEAPLVQELVQAKLQLAQADLTLHALRRELSSARAHAQGRAV